MKALVIILCLVAPVLVQAQQQIEGQQARLSFKGLHLGMTLAEVAELTHTSFWTYKYSFSPIEKSKPDQQVFLHADNGYGHKKHGDENSFSSIGHSGRPGSEVYYNWDYASVYFHEGRVYKISVSSFDYTADKIDSYVKEWLDAAKQGLTEKYGEPRKTFLNIPEIGIMQFQPGFTSYVCDWIIADQRIVLGIDETESKFSVSIEYLDMTIENRLKEGDKIKTDL